MQTYLISAKSITGMVSVPSMSACAENRDCVAHFNGATVKLAKRQQIAVPKITPFTTFLLMDCEEDTGLLRGDRPRAAQSDLASRRMDHNRGRRRQAVLVITAYTTWTMVALFRTAKDHSERGLSREHSFDVQRQEP